MLLELNVCIKLITLYIYNQLFKFYWRTGSNLNTNCIYYFFIRSKNYQTNENLLSYYGKEVALEYTRVKDMQVFNSFKCRIKVRHKIKMI